MLNKMQAQGRSNPVLIRKQVVTAVSGAERKNQSRLETAAILAFAFLLFLTVRQATRYIAFPDENFDYMEQAYRLVHGYGTPAWTFELGMRSWIFPGLLAGAMWLIEHPDRGVVEPEDLDHEYILNICRPYLGPVVGSWSDWSPLKDRDVLFPEPNLDRKDPWQFENFRVRR